MFDKKHVYKQFVWQAGAASGRWARAIREKDVPLIWLSCLSTPSGRELYCVNQSGVKIDSLSVIRSCHTCIDGEYFHKGVPELYYENIQSDEAVKVDHYDEYYDLDILLGLKIKVVSELLGERIFSSKMVMGGTKRDEVLLWSNQLDQSATTTSTF